MTWFQALQAGVERRNRLETKPFVELMAEYAKLTNHGALLESGGTMMSGGLSRQNTTMTSVAGNGISSREREELTNMRMWLQEQVTESYKLKSEITHLKDEKETLQKELSTATEKCNTLEQVTKKQLAQLGMAYQENDQLTSQNEVLQGTVTELNGKVESLLQSLLNLQKDFDAFKATSASTGEKETIKNSPNQKVDLESPKSENPEVSMEWLPDHPIARWAVHDKSIVASAMRVIAEQDGCCGLLTAAEDGDLSLINCRRPEKPIGTLPANAASPITTLDLSFGMSHCLLGRAGRSSLDIHISLLSLPNFRPLRSYRGPSARIVNVAFMGSQHHQFVSASMDRCVRLWNTDRDAPVRTALTTSNVSAAALDFFSAQYAVGHHSGDLQVFDMRSLKSAFHVEQAHRQRITGVKYSSDGRLATLGADFEMHVWDPRNMVRPLASSHDPAHLHQINEQHQAQPRTRSSWSWFPFKSTANNNAHTNDNHPKSSEPVSLFASGIPDVPIVSCNPGGFIPADAYTEPVWSPSGNVLFAASEKGFYAWNANDGQRIEITQTPSKVTSIQFLSDVFITTHRDGLVIPWQRKQVNVNNVRP